MIAIESKAKDSKRRPKSETAEAYADRLRWQNEANRKAASAFRDFGPIPKPKDRKRRTASKRRLLTFCRTYQSETFSLDWSDDHRAVAKKIERSVRKGGLYALAMPRASGKTSLVEAAALWSILHGLRKYLVLIGATEELAKNLLTSIRTELESNELLAEDFPEVCFVYQKLEGVTTRRLISEGRRVRLTLKANEIVLPWIDGGGRRNGASAGSILQVVGITGAIRGRKSKLPDGRTVRPDFVVVDDPQTDESAMSPSQVETREKTLSGAILGLSGPGEKIAGICPCTVIADGDLADRILNSDIHPEWNGSRIPFVHEFPERLDLWETYAEIRADSLRELGDISQATEFYRKNRSRMDAGSRVMWEARFEPDELSALQHAMNRKSRDEAAFWSEYQNNPRRTTDDELLLQNPTDISKRLNGLDRGRCLPGTDTITAFVDVQGRALFWSVVGWRSDFTGSVLDYGTFPDQGGRRYYQLKDLTKTIPKTFTGAGEDGGISAALRAFIPELLGRRYLRADDEVEISPSLILIDANWKTSTIRDTVRSFRSPNVFPAHGRYVGATSKPVQEYKKSRGEKTGLGWKTSVIEKLPHVLFDTNFWKSFIHDRLAIEFGDPGNLTFFGIDHLVHRMISENLVAEYRLRVTASNGRSVDEWKLKSSKPDNHFLDCLVGAAVGASLMGAAVPGLGEPIKTRRRRRARISYH
mgnify:CR=1 FL=1